MNKKQIAAINIWKTEKYKKKQANSNRSDSLKKSWIKRREKCWKPKFIDYIDEKTLSKNSGKHIWFTCNKCGVGLLTQYRIYNNSNNLCRSCNSKEKWKNINYRKNQLNSTRAESSKASTENLIDICKKYNYTYIGRNVYRDKHTVIIYKCDKGHIQEKRLSAFSANIPGCYQCSNNTSFPEKEIANYIKSLNIDIIKNNRELISPYELDIIIPEKKIAIEYCGLYWHSELKGKDKKYHINKLELCNEKGYRLITIFEDEWINKKEIIKTRLEHIFNKNDNKIYARKCEIQIISGQQAKRFIDKYHIQGYTGCSVKLGAFYNNKLVSVMTFGKPSISKGQRNKTNKIYEISRFCSSCFIIGIAGKLLKHFQRNYVHNKIFTYADRRWDTGNVYEKIGFRKAGNTKPNYWYFNTPNKRLHRFNFRKNILVDKLEVFDKKKTEWENMVNNGWNRIWDCGNFKFIKE